MALKPGALKAGLKAGMMQEQSKADRFALADKAAQEFPDGLLGPSVAPPQPSFSAERPPQATPGRQIVRIPIELLSDNPLNARKIYDPKIIQERAASMAKLSQKTPVSVAIDPSRLGRYILIDGHYRKRAAQSLNWHDLECIIEDIRSKLDFYRLSFELNEQRASQTALDNALAWQELLETREMASNVQISETLGVSEANVAKTLAMLSLPNSVVDLMREHPQAIGLATGYELVLYAKVAGPEEVLVAASRAIAGELSSREIAELRKSIVEPRTRKSKEISRQYKIRGAAGGALGFIKDWDNGRVVLDVMVPDPNVRAAVIEELRVRFGVGEH